MERLDALKALLVKVEAGTCESYDPALEFALYPIRKKMSDVYEANKANLGSIDAAKSLHEAVLPGWDWITRNGSAEDAVINYPDGGPDRFFANTYQKNPNFGGESFPSWGGTPSRAWLIAILKALIAQEGV